MNDDRSNAVWEKISRRRWRRVEWSPDGVYIISVVEGTLDEARARKKAERKRKKKARNQRKK